MINSIGPTGTGRLDQPRAQGVQRGATAIKVDSVTGVVETPVPASPAAQVAAAGAPVDYARVQEIRAAIANGAYALEVKAIAAKMIELDLPPRGK